MSHINIPIFVPHIGCPHTCVFCNQRRITGQDTIRLDRFDETVEAVLSTVDPQKHEVQIAFFGGSFTAIEKELMCMLLQKAKRYTDEGSVTSLRVSTRPDAIDEEILSILAAHSVTVVELGIQSTNDEVLLSSERGHTAKDCENACRLVKKYGFELVGQMMLGLPSSSLENEIKTATDMIAWGIDKARIYPTVVFADTALHTMMQNGSYTPLSLESAVTRGEAVYSLFAAHRIDVIRIGLCETEGLRYDATVSGAYHPALGELIINRHYLMKILQAASKVTLPPHAALVIETAPGTLSRAIGQKKCNLKELERVYPNNRILFRTSDACVKNEVKILVKEN